MCPSTVLDDQRDDSISCSHCFGGNYTAVFGVIMSRCRTCFAAYAVLLRGEATYEHVRPNAQGSADGGTP